MFFMRTADLPQALEAWARQYSVFAPQGAPGNVHLAPYAASPFSRTTDLDHYVNTVMSPKTFLFKEREPLFTWEDGEKMFVASTTHLSQPVNGVCTDGTLLFGVRPCDAYGFAYMDRFFLGEYQDINFSLRRRKLFVVALNCTQPGSGCFCSAFGDESGPFANSGYDLLLTPDGDRYWVEYGTEKGKWLLTHIAPLVHQDYEHEGPARKEAILAEVKTRFVRRPDFGRLKTALAAGFDHPLWERMAPGCISCTGCTRVCPTCTCFTTDEERLTERSGTRVRHWDSCQATSFTRNAEWHNPRSHAGAVRYRIYDKLTYIEERFGMKGCTGCGRCSATCPAAIDIVKVAEELMAECPANAPEPQPSRVHFDRQERLFDPQLYTPHLAQILAINDEAPSIRRFTLRFTEKPNQGRPALRGQFYMLTDFGVGEIAISIPFSDRVRDEFSFYIKKVGKVTRSLFSKKPGDVLGLRGPFGVPLPYETLKGRDLVVVGSGVGHAPVRATLIRAIENKHEFGQIVIIASALSYQGLILKDDLKEWASIPGVRVIYALSKPTDEVTAHVGYINDLLPDLGLDWNNASAIVCASARRIKAVAKDLMRLGMKPSDIYTALETNMRCGVGKCGHCKVGAHYMCVDGPVFTYEEMLQLPPEF